MIRTATMLTLAMMIAIPTANASHGATVWVGMDDAQSGVANLRFFPETVWVHAGGTVTFKANSATPHTATAYPPSGAMFDSSPAVTMEDPTLASWFGPSGFLMPGQSFEHVFDQEGVFTVFCKIHPGMSMSVNVSADSPSSPTLYVDAGWGSGDTTVDLFSLSSANVAPGTAIVWTNKHSAEPHTVTSGDGGFDSSPAVMGPPGGFVGPQGVMEQGGANAEFATTFMTPGSFPYFCKLHPGMWGTVAVLDATDSEDDDDDGASAPGPALPLVLLAVIASLAFVRGRGRR